MTGSSLNVLQALFFYPRGGSAQVVRYLTAALRRREHECRIVAGSAGETGDQTDARTFFDNAPVYPFDYNPALVAWQQGNDPLLASPPLHPSYEDRAGVPDRMFASVSPDIARHIENEWQTFLGKTIDSQPDLFHVHHLTPLQPAITSNWPEVPLIGHIHGTELKMLKAIDDRERIARALELDLERDWQRIEPEANAEPGRLTERQHDLVKSTRWDQWRYAEWWRQRLHEYAHLCDRIFVLSELARDEVADWFGFDPARIDAIPNGVDITRFFPKTCPAQEQLARLKHWLVEEPHGWDETGRPGSVNYTEREVEEWFLNDEGNRSPVLMFVGRFVNMKRVPLLIRAYADAQKQFACKTPLVIWGGNPGEWEDEHPVTVVRQESVDGVFFVGWRGHNELPAGLNVADVMVAPSTNEPFGQVYLEAMACGLPVIGTRSGGPPSFVNTDPDAPNGWLVEPDNRDDLAAAMVQAVNDQTERARRGENALQHVREHYSWDGIAERVEAIYEEVIAEVRAGRRDRPG